MATSAETRWRLIHSLEGISHFDHWVSSAERCLQSHAEGKEEWSAAAIRSNYKRQRLRDRDGNPLRPPWNREDSSMPADDPQETR